ncbi:tetratricopeptide repeat protein [Novosphingopyxis sp.]|uniref:tetratricopeptide repeat protein n=1 Tax=Novosphingopyxis sp. TaxID=2709690 RepID=UPI003B58C28F
MEDTAMPETGRTDRLAGYLEQDPGNIALMTDLIEAALNEDRAEVARKTLARLEAAGGGLDRRARHLAGLEAMQRRDFSAAEEHFRILRDAGVDEPAVRFNHGWSLAMEGDHEAALEAVDAASAQSLASAAMLRVQVLHQLGRWDDAIAEGRRYAALYPDDPGLMAALSVLAIDTEDEEFAAACAAKAGDHPDALAARGTLALAERDNAGATALFERALERNPHNPRGWIGLGLAKLNDGEAKAAARDLDRGADMFGTHLGSWVAAGWAHYVGGDADAARERFERACEIDPTFAEPHGALAVLDIVAGDLDRGRERAEVARRLDRESFGAALAAMLLKAGEGDEAQAKRIFDLAISRPIDEKGRTLAQFLATIRP